MKTRASDAAANLISIYLSARGREGDGEGETRGDNREQGVSEWVQCGYYYQLYTILLHMSAIAQRCTAETDCAVVVCYSSVESSSLLQQSVS